MKRSIIGTFLLFVSFCSPFITDHSDDPLPETAVLHSKVIQIASQQSMTASDFAGLSDYLDSAWEGKGSAIVLVGEGDSIVFYRNVGYADFATNEKINDQSLCDMASVSKQFTAEAIMLLKHGNLISYSDTLRKFFPELKYPDITIRHLLTHTSGLPAYEDGASLWDTSKIAFNKDVIAILAKENPPLLFKPGEKWQYSNTGYVLLASIVEKVSGKTFNEFLTEKIFQPIRMNRSRIYNTRRSGEVIPNYCYGYVWDEHSKRFMLPDDLPEYRYVYYLDGIIGDGCVNTTAKELFLWDRALQHNRILPKNEQDSAYIPARLNNGSLAELEPGITYGFGWIIEDNPELGTVVEHEGGWPGYQTLNWRSIGNDRTVICFVTAEPPAW